MAPNRSGLLVPYIYLFHSLFNFEEEKKLNVDKPANLTIFFGFFGFLFLFVKSEVKTQKETVTLST